MILNRPSLLRGVLLVLVLVVASAAFFSASCSSVVRGVANVVGQPFPSVEAKALDGKVVRVPQDFADRVVVAILATDQDAQFDVDRWLLGLLDKGTPATIRELPTVAGFIPGLISGTIDNGMRKGIPSEDWGAVLTLYGSDAKKLVAHFGNENGRNGRVVLIDRQGIVRWTHDRGYSARVLLELDAAVRSLL